MRFSTLLVGAAATLVAAGNYDSTVVLTTLIYSTHTIQASSSTPPVYTPTQTPDTYKTTDKSVIVSTAYNHLTTTIAVPPKYTPVSPAPTTYAPASETTASAYPPSYTGAAPALKGGVSGAMVAAALVAALI